MKNADYHVDVRESVGIGDYGIQGDVIIKKIEKPKNFENLKKSSNGIIAHGEETGHAHELTKGNFDLRKAPLESTFDGTSFYFQVKDYAALLHEEHSPIIIGPGFYKVEIQQEYDHFERKQRFIRD